MLVSIFDGIFVDLVVTLSTAKPSELSSRLGAMLLFAILAIWFCLASWMVYLSLIHISEPTRPY